MYILENCYHITVFLIYINAIKILISSLFILFFYSAFCFAIHPYCYVKILFIMSDCHIGLHHIISQFLYSPIFNGHLDYLQILATTIWHEHPLICIYTHLDASFFELYAQCSIYGSLHVCTLNFTKHC